MKRILLFFIRLTIAFIALYNGNAFPQLKVKDKEDDAIINQWYSSLEKARIRSGATKEEYQVFNRFFGRQLDSIRASYGKTVLVKGINSNAGSKIIAENENTIADLYKKYKVIKKHYPSSVEEYGHPYHNLMNICDTAGCNNIDFESGNLNGWYAYYAYNNNVPYLTHFNLTNITGGLLGAVTIAANDTLTSTPGYYNTGVGPNPRPDYQVKITSGTLADGIVPSVSQVSPFGGKHSVMLGDSTQVNYGAAILSKTFYVTAANDILTYEYAVFLENPVGHLFYQQPFFSVVLLDQKGDTIPHCGEYVVVSSDTLNGFNAVYYPPSADSVYYKNWTIVGVSLKRYIGQCVTIIFEDGDCGKGGHFGYAYVDASCAPLGLISSSPALCGQKSISVNAPPGFQFYKWTGPAGGIVGSDSTRTINVDSAGTYQVQLIPVTGATCADTLSITIPKAAGPPPIPSFLADTVCLGSATQFVNTSNPGPGPGVKYYWDFYNLGSFEDSTSNPLWTYTFPGTYTVKLYEINNGCGADTLIKVQVDSAFTTSFTFTNSCLNQNVIFTNTSTGASSYKWNFGDPASGPANTSTLTNPTHIYSALGTYTATLIGRSGGGCPPDTVKEVIHIVTQPKPIISGKDSVCLGSTITLTVSAPGATGFLWMPDSLTTSSIVITPSTSATYTITATNGACSHDTIFPIYVFPIPVAGITTIPDTICIGDSAHLIGSGGPSYSWTTGSTADNIWVSPTTLTSYSLTVTKNGCSATANASVDVEYKTPPVIGARDTICVGDTIKITAGGADSYLWSTGATTNSIIVSPPVGVFKYWVIAKNKCFTDSLFKTIYVLPLPVPFITFSTDSICPNTNAVLIAHGGISYLWSTGQTTSNIVVHPAVNTTYTVTVSNGFCFADTVFTLKTKPAPVVSVFGTNIACQGDSISLYASAPGGGTYSWSTGASTSSITVVATLGTDYFWVSMTKGCSDTARDTITVKPVSPMTTLGDTTIAWGVAVNLYASGAVTYLWMPGGTLSCTTCPDPIATPTASTTYTVAGTDSNGCIVYGYVVLDMECGKYIIPNVFTPPNGDPKDPENNVFLIKEPGGNPYIIEIYDRWGKLMYKSGDPSKPWNGKVNNTDGDVPSGVYYYILRSTCNGKDREDHGFVQVIRSDR
ncbi:MAG TPA: PKD domain-containing protein [Bacteroidia bacterium]|nr:PKD domain-containing protein [Bacteroidia bacterium]